MSLLQWNQWFCLEMCSTYHVEFSRWNNILHLTPHLPAGVRGFLYFQDSDQWQQTRAEATRLWAVNTWYLGKQLRFPWQKKKKVFQLPFSGFCTFPAWNSHLQAELPTSCLLTCSQMLPSSSFQCISQHRLYYPHLYLARKAPEGLHSSVGISAESYNKSFAFCVSTLWLFC